MIRWLPLPQSLFGRMILILMSVLVLAQFISLAIRQGNREDFFYETHTIETARHIADTVKVLDAVSPAERPKLVAMLSTPSLSIRLNKAPVEPDSLHFRQRSHAAVFDVILRGYLGNRWPIDVLASRVTPDGLTFQVQVRLRDQTWVSFRSDLPDETGKEINRLLPKILILLATVILFSLIAVRWVTSPLRALASAAEALGRDIHRHPLAEEGPVEVRRAAHAFNTMQAQLVGYIRERTRILAAVSHDLKTPITRLRLRVEVLDDPELKSKFVNDLAEMESMVAATLDFIRGIGTEETVQPVDVMALLESLQRDAEEMGHHVSISGRVEAPYLGNPQALKRCLANILDNAVNYGREAAFFVEDSPERLAIRVQDQGPGIPETEMEKVFDPFYRLEVSRNRASGGTGLGLTIARNIARAHGGDLTLRNRAEQGLEVSLTLSRARKPDRNSKGAIGKRKIIQRIRNKLLSR